MLGHPTDLDEEEIIAVEDYLAEGYGILNKEVTEAIRIVAETEGMLLDPVYTGKAMMGLLDWIRKDRFDKGANIVFLHSGGTPALFPYRDKLISFLGD
jgi:1-aminocyclopropane-1-carboxylate deaminase/D-cysteine desulfhydrase-like pyridoxal-dependent ACC family enzyme